MNVNFDQMMKGRQAWRTFTDNHPKFPAFLKACRSKGITEGTEILITVTYPDGETMRAGLNLKQSDFELLEMLKGFNK